VLQAIVEILKGRLRSVTLNLILYPLIPHSQQVNLADNGFSFHPYVFPSNGCDYGADYCAD
jgi:hypothetical protein